MLLILKEVPGDATETLSLLRTIKGFLTWSQAKAAHQSFLHIPDLGLFSCPMVVVFYSLATPKVFALDLSITPKKRSYLRPTHGECSLKTTFYTFRKEI